MSDAAKLSASIRILELDLSAALQQVYDSKILPVELKVTAPRTGGLCQKIIDALQKRAPDMNAVDIFATNKLTMFAREKKIIYDTSVAGRDVFVVLDFALPDPAKVSAEYFLLASNLATDAYLSLAQQAGQAAQKNGAASVHLIMPNYAYARQDKDHGECGPISAEITAQNLEPFYDSVTSVHLHSPAIKGMFRDIPLREISPYEIYAPYFVCRDPVTLAPIDISSLTIESVNALFSQICIVSPDAGGAKNARDFLKYCKKFAATILNIAESQIVDLPMAQIDKRRSGPNESEVMYVLGREFVKGRRCVIIDDMGDTFGTATHAAVALQEAGAEDVSFLGTHGYFSSNASERIAKSPISKVTVTNSTALTSTIEQSGLAEIVDIAPALAQVIIDLSTKPDDNLRPERRHVDGDFQHRKALGRYVFAMLDAA